MRRIVTPIAELPPLRNENGQATRAIITLRVSPRPQDTEVSLAKQEAECREWCAK